MNAEEFEQLTKERDKIIYEMQSKEEFLNAYRNYSNQTDVIITWKLGTHSDCSHNILYRSGVSPVNGEVQIKLDYIEKGLLVDILRENKEKECVKLKERLQVLNKKLGITEK